MSVCTCHSGGSLSFTSPPAPNLTILPVVTLPAGSSDIDGGTPDSVYDGNEIDGGTP